MLDSGILRPDGQNESARFGTGDPAERPRHRFVRHGETAADRPLAYIDALTGPPQGVTLQPFSQGLRGDRFGHLRTSISE
ncbi:hypothetical protein [Streptomyces sp. NPDC001933]|uniref:hypothetical protein n=1 Tax=Streptomyces sp. NPDC001933 TaxID=3364626 RepID=UPI00368160E7